MKGGEEMLLQFPKEEIQPVVDKYLPFSKHIYFAFSGNNYLNSSLSDPSILPDANFELKLDEKEEYYQLEVNAEKFPKGWHKGKPVVPIQEQDGNGRVMVTWIDCPVNPPKPFRQEQKRKNWEFLV